MYWLPDMVFLDTETTGGSPLYSRLTEIGLIRIENGEITGRWETLVNPEVRIPASITGITGITNEMVKDAPTFKEIAGDLYGYLEGMVMAAHNARFDHGFLKAEFKRLGATLRQRTLCTVKLSRKLFPHHKGHSLDAIMQRHGLRTDARHRAMGDVQLLLDFLEAARRELGEAIVLQEINTLLKGPSLPPALDGAFLDEIPDAPGVYTFYDENETPLYIGKSVTLRSRVMSHFSSDHSSAREMKITQEIKRVEWIETAGELGALLLESKLIKERLPVYNRMLRQKRKLFSLQISELMSQTPWVKLVSSDEFSPSHFEYLYGMFRSKKRALETLRALADKHQLCGKMLGLETGKGACFSYQLKKCSGVCAGKERPELHYLRLRQAMISMRLKNWPFDGRIGIREQNKESRKTQVHVFDQWCHLGSVDDEIELDEILQSRSPLDFDMDTYKLLTKALKKPAHILKLTNNSRDVLYG
jgi:DNA polymerase-3 subunit epsilon